jgi:adenine-specific DNA-methyltransferase
MFGRSEHVPGVIFDETVLKRNKEADLPSNFLWFNEENSDFLPESVQEYIKEGEKEGLHKRYKCRIRKPWYSVPSVYSTPVSMLKRSHDFPRLILNKINAYTTDTAYRIQPKRFSSTSLVFSFINSLTALSAELEGRHYGGGVLELVPSEIRKLIIPVLDVKEGRLTELDRAMRSGLESEHLLATQDALTLEKAGLTKVQREELLNAWIRLRSRRQRR